MNWKRHRDGSFVRVLLTLLVAALALLEFAFLLDGVLGATEAVDRLAELPRGSLRAPVRGPAVYTGVIGGPPARATYFGEPSAAYVGWVTETTGSGKNQRTIVVCAMRGEVDQLTLNGDGGTVPLGVFPGLRWARLYERGTLDYDDPQGVLDLGPVRAFDVMPGALSAECQLGYSTGRLTYHQASAPPGAAVSVVACFDGAQLGPCTGGHDVVAVGGFTRVAAAWGAQGMLRARIAGVAAIVALVLLGFGTMRLMLRRDRARGGRA